MGGQGPDGVSRPVRFVSVKAVIAASKGMRPYRPSLVARLFMGLRWIVRWIDELRPWPR